MQRHQSKSREVCEIDIFIFLRWKRQIGASEGGKGIPTNPFQLDTRLSFSDSQSQFAARADSEARPSRRLIVEPSATGHVLAHGGNTSPSCTTDAGIVQQLSDSALRSRTDEQ